MCVILSEIGGAAPRAKDNSPRRKPCERGCYSKQPRRGRKSFVSSETTNGLPITTRPGVSIVGVGTCAGTEASVPVSTAPSGADSLVAAFRRLAPWATIFRPSGWPFDIQPAYAQAAWHSRQLEKRAALEHNPGLPARADSRFRARKCRNSSGRRFRQPATAVPCRVLSRSRAVVDVEP